LLSVTVRVDPIDPSLLARWLSSVVKPFSEVMLQSRR